MPAVLDTNVLVDYLCGVEPARAEIARYDGPAISVVTWMEVMVGAKRGADEARVRGFLQSFEVLPLTPEVAERAVKIRREHRIRLPDAIIWATALEPGWLLVTRNTRDFPADDPSIRVPYDLEA